MPSRNHESSKTTRSFGIWGIMLASCLAATAAISQQLSPLDSAQQTVVTSSRVVVVVIPGFPVESILLGILAGLLALHIAHRRRWKINQSY